MPITTSFGRFAASFARVTRAVRRYLGARLAHAEIERRVELVGGFHTMRQTMELAVVTVCALCGLAAGATSAAEYPVAGVKPYERPEGAPVISQVHRDRTWYIRAVQGIAQPYPESLRFLESQGNWSTPFNQPGMTGPYDIRGWHSQSARGSATNHDHLRGSTK